MIGLIRRSGEMDKILLFIPMYNCQKQIPRVLGQLDDEVLTFISEVMVVDNRSKDDGVSAAVSYCKNDPRLPVKIFRNDENYGLGGSHKVAFEYAVKNGFDYLIVLHGDDQGDISNILPYLKKRIYRRYDCFLGARFMRGSKLQGYSGFRTFGNIVYDILFSIGCRHRIYDLGSGLNMYRVAILKDKFYLKYRDDLMFNYCMVMGSAHHGHKVRFFPIVWREDDQVSNVRMLHQAVTVLKLLGSYIADREKFAASEHRDRAIGGYTAQLIYDNKEPTVY